MIHRNKIAFFYPSHFPIKGGSSIHGYYLVKYLSAAGFQLFTFPEQADGISTRLTRSLRHIVYAMRHADIVYVRMHPEGSTRFLLALAKFLRKKVIVEINGLPDELMVTKGYSDERIKFIDKRMRFYMRFADVVITPSVLLADYCTTYLKCKNVQVIENGGEHFDFAETMLDEDFISELTDIRQVHQKIAVWSGTANPWQGISIVETIAKISENDLGIIVISNDRHVEYTFQMLEKVYVFKGLSRDQIAAIFSIADCGMAFYDDHRWCRYQDYYGSSLKYYEYRANGLSVVVTPSGHLANVKEPDVLISNNEQEIYKWIMQNASRKKADYTYRSWQDVATETAQVIESLINKK